MSIRLISITLFLLTFIIGGCTFTRTLTTANGLSVIDYDASRRGAYVKEHKQGKPELLVIAEPSPDVAKQFTALLDTSFEGLKGAEAAKAKLELNSQVIDLAKRSQTLQILREALYRLSELYANGAISNAEACKMYVIVLNSVQAISLTELGNADYDHKTKSKLVDQLFSHVPTGNNLDLNKN